MLTTDDVSCKRDEPKEDQHVISPQFQTQAGSCFHLWWISGRIPAQQQTAATSMTLMETKLWILNSISAYRSSYLPTRLLKIIAAVPKLTRFHIAAVYCSVALCTVTLYFMCQMYTIFLIYDVPSHSQSPLTYPSSHIMNHLLVNRAVLLHRALPLFIWLMLPLILTPSSYPHLHLPAPTVDMH